MLFAHEDRQDCARGVTSIAIRPFQFGYLPSTHRRGQDDRNRNTRHPGGRAVLGLLELHAGLSEAKKTVDGSYGKQDGRFKDQEPLVNVQAIIELAASYGPVAINRAYCNWQFFGRYRDALLQGAVELIQLFPPGQSAKNGADSNSALMRPRTSSASNTSARSSSWAATATSCPSLKRSRPRGESWWVWARGARQTGTGQRVATTSGTTRPCRRGGCP